MKSVLLLTNTRDTSTDWIVEKLRYRNINFIRLNSDLLDQCSIRVTPTEFLYRDTINREWNLLDTVGVVYLRRPDPPVTARFGCDPEEYAVTQYIEGQWNALVRGLQVLNAEWINPLAANRLAESKIAQLHMAQNIGFNLPKTLITNDPNEAKKFASEQNSIVSKALDAPLLELPDHSDFIYTQLIDKKHLNDCDAELRMAPTIFQQAITQKTDIRVTVIGNTTISAEIKCSTDEIDWRRVSSDQIKLKQTTLDQDLQKKCIAFVRALGLIYGSIDFVRYKNELFFLELNPSGEWGWLQYSGLPISDSIVDSIEDFL